MRVVLHRHRPSNIFRRRGRLVLTTKTRRQGWDKEAYGMQKNMQRRRKGRRGEGRMVRGARSRVVQCRVLDGGGRRRRGMGEL